ncbi:MAG: hypothetical protein KC561_14000 [Myxococcales bacterium]|nr:hypothetical protein [Myxococcales bacterium]
MRLFSVTLFQTPERAAMAEHFYSQLLGLPEPVEYPGDTFMWFSDGVRLASQPDPEVNEEPETISPTFSGLQFNLVPAADLNPIVARIRGTGIRQPEPRELPDGRRVVSVHDPSGNVLMLVGLDEETEEPSLPDGIASCSLFSADLARSKQFFCEGLSLPIRAELGEDLLVLDSGSATAILIYKAADPSNPNTPVGRRTGLNFSSLSPAETLDQVEKSGGAVLDRLIQPSGVVSAGTFTDPDGNQFTLLDQTALIETGSEDFTARPRTGGRRKRAE